jgi:hypothetical protein
MAEHIFGEVKVLEETGKNKAVIRFPSQIVSVVEAEGFLCDLMRAIEKARQIIRDPI